MSEPPLTAEFLSLPKAELHLHLEGSIEPATVCELAARQGAAVSEAEARRRYAYRNFAEFIEAFKWVTSYLRTPEDYAVITRELAGRLIEQNVVASKMSRPTLKPFALRAKSSAEKAYGSLGSLTPCASSAAKRQ